MPLFVAETKPRAEVTALAQLKRQGFDAFYPTCRLRRTSKRGAIELIMPLFPRYIFVELELDKQRWRSVNGTLGVRRLLGADPELPDRVPEDVASTLRFRSARGPEDDPREALNALYQGVRVRVNSGPLEDHIGRVDRLDGRDRVVVLMYLLGRLGEVSCRRAEVDRIAD